MRFRVSVFDENEDINMAPMIDMVFLLLIFFMIASHMNEIERVSVELPVADEAKISDQTSNRTLITIRSNDKIGENIDIIMNLDQIDIQQLDLNIKKVQETNPKSSICLRIGRYVKSKHVKKIMKICADHGFSDIIFSTFEADI